MANENGRISMLGLEIDVMVKNCVAAVWVKYRIQNICRLRVQLVAYLYSAAGADGVRQINAYNFGLNRRYLHTVTAQVTAQCIGINSGEGVQGIAYLYRVSAACSISFVVHSRPAVRSGAANGSNSKAGRENRAYPSRPMEQRIEA